MLTALWCPEAAWIAKQQYERYCEGLEAVFREASERSHEPCVVPFAGLARFAVSSTDGVLLRFLEDHDITQATLDLDRIIEVAQNMAHGDEAIKAK